MTLSSIIIDSQETDCNQLDFHRFPSISKKSITMDYFFIDSHRLWVKIWNISSFFIALLSFFNNRSISAERRGNRRFWWKMTLGSSTPLPPVSYWSIWRNIKECSIITTHCLRTSNNSAMWKFDDYNRFCCESMKIDWSWCSVVLWV